MSVTAGDPGTGDGIATLVALSSFDIWRLDISVSHATGVGWGIDNLHFLTIAEPFTVTLTGLGAIIIIGGLGRREL